MISSEDFPNITPVNHRITFPATIEYRYLYPRPSIPNCYAQLIETTNTPSGRE